MEFEKKDNVIKITIKNINLEEFLENIKKHFDKSVYHKISLSMLLKDCNIIDKIKPQTIYILEDKNTIYNINILKNNNIYILEKTFENDIHYKTLITKDEKTLEYIIEISSYNLKNKEKKHEIIKDKKLVLNYIRKILENIKRIDYYNHININTIYNHFNLISYDKLNPIITDGLISLSCRSKEAMNNINDSMCQFFDIILEDTKENIGYILFHYYERKFNYEGNVTYLIYEKFRNNHYATKALNLLKKILKNNKFDGNKDLYIATKTDNNYSSKVALNNGAQLIYEGKSPIDDKYDFIEESQNVKVYKIKI